MKKSHAAHGLTHTKRIKTKLLPLTAQAGLFLPLGECAKNGAPAARGELSNHLPARGRSESPKFDDFHGVFRGKERGKERML